MTVALEDIPIPGSYVALRLALDHPGRVTRLALLDSVPISEALDRKHSAPAGGGAAGGGVSRWSFVPVGVSVTLWSVWPWWDLGVAGSEEMSRDELIVVVRRQAGQLDAQDRQIAAMAGQLSELTEANEALAAKLATVEHLLSRNSGNSSSPPSKDDDPGKPAPPVKGQTKNGPLDRHTGGTTTAQRSPVAV